MLNIIFSEEKERNDVEKWKYFMKIGRKVMKLKAQIKNIFSNTKSSVLFKNYLKMIKYYFSRKKKSDFRDKCKYIRSKQW